VDVRFVDLLIAIGGAIGGFLAALIFAVAYGVIDRQGYETNAVTILLVATIVIYAGLFLGILRFLRRLPDPIRWLGLRRPTGGDFGLVGGLLVIWFVGEGVLVTVVTSVLNQGKPVPSNTREMFNNRGGAIWILLLALLGAAVVAPICEELFFRGMLYPLPAPAVARLGGRRGQRDHLRRLPLHPGADPGIPLHGPDPHHSVRDHRVADELDDAARGRQRRDHRAGLHFAQLLALDSAPMSQAVEELNRRMLRARDAMDRAYAQPLDIPALAGIASVSEAHFIRTFRATFGETPHRYLQRRRVERAMYLLRATERHVTDICLDVGFSSLGTFSRSFRDIVGETPSAYRERGPIQAIPNCFAMAWTRPSSFGEARTADRP